MLNKPVFTKRQLEDALNCENFYECRDCSCMDKEKYDAVSMDCDKKSAQTALTLLDKVECQQQEIKQKDEVLRMARMTISDAIALITSGRLSSIGSINNTYTPQISVKSVEFLRDNLSIIDKALGGNKDE